jgi:hypothetical protein
MAVALAALAAGCGKDKKSEEPVYEFAFTGSVTINETKYDVAVNGKDKKFEVLPGSLPPIKGGTYTVTANQGYTFAFADANGTEVRSQYDTAKKEHSFIYTLDLAARGFGNVRLVFKDEGFVRAAEPWSDIPVFTGSFTAILEFPMVISCKADGSFGVAALANPGYVAEHGMVGTYEYKNGAYVFDLDGTIYTSALDPESGLHKVEFYFVMTYIGAPSLTVMTQQVLTAD